MTCSIAPHLLHLCGFHFRFHCMYLVTLNPEPSDLFCNKSVHQGRLRNSNIQLWLQFTESSDHFGMWIPKSQSNFCLLLNHRFFLFQSCTTESRDRVLCSCVFRCFSKLLSISWCALTSKRPKQSRVFCCHLIHSRCSAWGTDGWTKPE